MKLSELEAKLRSLSQGIAKADQKEIQIIAANEMEALIKQRVFAKGQDSNGSKIGNYNTEEIYVNPNKLSSLIPKGGLVIRGKNSEDPVFKNGNKRKTAYLQNGYKQFKDKANFDSSIYNLTLTGVSKDSIKGGLKGDNYVLGFSDTDRQVILEGHEKRLNKKIFAPTKEELIIVNKIILSIIRQKIKDRLKK